MFLCPNLFLFVLLEKIYLQRNEKYKVKNFQYHIYHKELRVNKTFVYKLLLKNTFNLQVVVCVCVCIYIYMYIYIYVYNVYRWYVVSTKYICLILLDKYSYI